MVTAFKMIIEYDGSAFCGWQIQNDAPTIQAAIENTLQRMTGQRIRVTASGRTDAGVHALGQVAGFRCDTRLSAMQLHKGLNSLLTPDIVIHSLTPVAVSFHPRFDALSKIYRYHILNRPLPKAIGRQYVWHLRRPLDVAAMQRAAGHLVGTHDFKAFEGAGSPRKTTVRRVMKASVAWTDGDRLVFEIEADGFLRFMVRNIVGTLVDVGLGRRSADDFKRILSSRERELAGPTAPPQGLFLVQVKYPV